MAKRKKPTTEIEVRIASDTGNPKAMIDGVAVYCNYDKLAHIKTLKSHPKNPNRHPSKQIELLAQIIKAQGWRAPITVSTLSGYIVRGHGRLAAAKKLKASLAPVEYQNYKSEADELADLIADNKIAELSEISKADFTAAINEIQSFDSTFNLIRGLTGDASDNDDIDNIPDFDKGVVTKRGDIYTSTLIAAEVTGRTCFMSEIDPYYCDIVIQRYLKLIKDADKPVNFTRNGKPELSLFEKR